MIRALVAGALSAVFAAGVAFGQDELDRAMGAAVGRAAAARDGRRVEEMKREVAAAAALAGDAPVRRRVLAATLVDHGFHEIAVQVCRQTLPRAAADPGLQGVYGIALAKTKRYPEAVTELTAAAAKQPQVKVWWIELGRAHLMANQEAAALAAIDRAIALWPDDVAVLEVLAECQYRNMRLAECEATARKLLAAHGRNLLAWQLLARVQRAQGRSEEAIKTAESAIRTVGRNPEIVIELGIALLAAGRTEEAVAALAEVAEKNPDERRAFQHMARAYAKLGKTEEAAAAKRRYLALSPDVVKPASRPAR